VYALAPLLLILVGAPPSATSPVVADAGRVKAPMVLQSISYEVRPTGGGMAFCSYERDGHTTGGHLSGDQPPFVHQDAQVLPAAVITRLFELAAALGPELLSARQVPDASWGGAAQLSITFVGGASASLSWKANEQPGDARVKALLDFISVHHVGGW
jgi:hypothetical protein